MERGKVKEKDVKDDEERKWDLELFVEPRRESHHSRHVCLVILVCIFIYNFL